MDNDTRTFGRAVVVGTLAGLGVVAVVWLVGGWQATFVAVLLGVVIGLAIGLVQRAFDRGR